MALKPMADEKTTNVHRNHSFYAICGEFFFPYYTCFWSPKHLNTLSLTWHILSLYKVTALPSLLTGFTLCSCGRWPTMSLSLQMVFHWLTVALIGATWPCLAQNGLLFLHKSQGVTPQKDKELYFVIDFWAQIPQNEKRGVKMLSEMNHFTPFWRKERKTLKRAAYWFGGKRCNKHN